MQEETASLLKRDSSNSKPVTDSNPPSVYYKGASHLSKRVIPDFSYKGNHLDVAHLSAKRMGPTPHLSQLQFETGLRHYGSQLSLKNEESSSRNVQSNLVSLTENTPNNNHRSRFVTVFGKVPRFDRVITGDVIPTFLPPLKEEGMR